MPWKSRWHIDIPNVSLPTYLFGGQDDKLDDKPVFLDADQPSYSLSNRTYREWSKRLAAGLRARGFQDGDRLLLYSGNTIFFPVVLIGTIMAGGIFSGANPTYVARELAYQLQDTGAKFLITAEGSLDTALEAAKTIGFPKDKILSFDGGYDTFDGKGKPSRGNIQHWSTLLASPEEGARYRWQEFNSRAQMDQTVVLNYSSGTTGVPKGVQITHLNYVSNCMQTDHVANLDPDYEAVAARSVGLSMLPMYHAYGQTVHCVSAPRKNIPVYVMQKFDFGKMLHHIQDYRVTGLTLVPPIVVALAKRPEARKFDLSSVESAGCGAAPLGSEPQKEFEGLWPAGQVNLKQGWGMTEITCSACGMDPTAVATDATVGELNPNIEAMIVSDDGKEVGVNERGEFWVRGPNVMKGYWNKPEATRDTLTPDGWLKTGDIAFRNEKGFIYIVDRMKVSHLRDSGSESCRLKALTNARSFRRSSSKSKATKSPRPNSKPSSSTTQPCRTLRLWESPSTAKSCRALTSRCKKTARVRRRRISLRGWRRKWPSTRGWWAVSNSSTLFPRTRLERFCGRS
jgi:4-coumarate--CoA ligase